jgi:hypothetical protein
MGSCQFDSDFFDFRLARAFPRAMGRLSVTPLFHCAPARHLFSRRLRVWDDYDFLSRCV